MRVLPGLTSVRIFLNVTDLINGLLLVVKFRCNVDHENLYSWNLPPRSWLPMDSTDHHYPFEEQHCSRRPFARTATPPAVCCFPSPTPRLCLSFALPCVSRGFLRRGTRRTSHLNARLGEWPLGCQLSPPPPPLMYVDETGQQT